ADEVPARFGDEQVALQAGQRVAAVDREAASAGPPRVALLAAVADREDGVDELEGFVRGRAEAGPLEALPVFAFADEVPVIPMLVETAARRVVHAEEQAPRVVHAQAPLVRLGGGALAGELPVAEAVAQPALRGVEP